jgi:general secretion pathway protein N
MTAADMMRRPAIRLTFLLTIALGVATPTSALPSDLSDLDADTPLDAKVLPGSSSQDLSAAAAPAVVVKPAQPVAAAIPHAASANPLWAIPLATLSNTRERPIFSSSRRPPPPAAVAALASAPPAPKPVRVERPQLSLVGTITGDDQSFGIFVDRSSKAALRLKLGEEYQGWTLRSVQGREATLARDQQTAILSLPQPGAGEAGPLRVQAENVAPIPVPADPPPRTGGRH